MTLQKQTVVLPVQAVPSSSSSYTSCSCTCSCSTSIAAASSLYHQPSDTEQHNHKPQLSGPKSLQSIACATFPLPNGTVPPSLTTTATANTTTITTTTTTTTTTNNNNNNNNINNSHPSANSTLPNRSPLHNCLRHNLPNLQLPRSRTVNDGISTPPLSRASSSTVGVEPSSFSVARHLCGLETDDEFVAAPIEDVWSVATKRRGVYNLIQVPLRLERLLFFTQAICLHDFLSVFTFLPFRLALSILYLLFLVLSYPFRVALRSIPYFSPSMHKTTNKAPQRQKQEEEEHEKQSHQHQQQEHQRKQHPPSPRKKSKRRKNRNNSPQNSAHAANSTANHHANHANSSSAPPSNIAHPGNSSVEEQDWTQRLVSCAIDFTHVSLLVITIFVLRLFDTSRIYHSIRGQSAIKLYVVFNAIEIFDRLCSSFGVDMLDSLGWTTASAVSFLSRRSPTTSSSSSSGNNNNPSGRDSSSTTTNNDDNNLRFGGGAIQAIILLARMLIDYLFALAYVLIHATLLLTWLVTLNVCINTQNNALVTLLVSNNFVELKGHAFKSYKVPNVFQIACADAVERFQLSMFLVLMMADGPHPKLLVTWGVIYACELVVDWIKHAFMLKFNRMTHRVYRQFGLVISEAIVRARGHGVVRSVGGSTVSKRIGFVTLPLAATAVRIAATPAARLPLPALALSWLILLLAKCALNICITGHAWRRVCRGFDDGSCTEEERERDEYWVQKLMQVERYDLISKS